MSHSHNILVLPGDGIGPDVIAEALKVLDTVAASSKSSIKFHYTHALLGGCSIDAHGVPLTPEVIQQAKDSDAVLFGAVGGPKWEKGTGPRAESGVLQLRKELNAFANLRPCRIISRSLESLSPLKREVIEGTDFMLVRENCGGAYFGEKVEKDDYAMDPWEYSSDEVRRVVRVAAELARSDGRGSLISCDKANVLASSRLWRRVTTEVMEKEYPDIKLRHWLADSAAMSMMLAPRDFNGVVVMDNTFGDILSDVSSVIPGSLGLLPSASISSVSTTEGGAKTVGLFEPIHGSAPDIAGKGIANPVATILSAAMMLKYAFGLHEEATAVEKAVEKVLDAKDIGGLEVRTRDLGGQTSTAEMGDAVCAQLRKLLKGE